jgi:hypothetical protein
MENLDRSYWIKHRSILAVAGLSGFLFVAWIIRMPGNNQKFILSFFPVFALLFSPFTLKTAVGRLWWGTFLIALGSGLSAVLCGIQSPVSWFCAFVAGCAYAIGVCLRWNPPTA